MSRGGRQAGASSCRRCINTARRAQCSPRNKGEKSVREEAKGPREGLGGGGGRGAKRRVSQFDSFPGSRLGIEVASNDASFLVLAQFYGLPTSYRA